MVIAKGKVIIGEKVYTAGETVTGLSKADISRMARDGFIEVREDVKPKDNKNDSKKKESRK